MQRVEKWAQDGGELGQSRHPAGKSLTVYVEGGQERSISHVETDSPVEWQTLVLEAQGRQERMFQCVLGD